MKEKDRWLKCIDCETEFIFEIGEQEFYKKHGLFTPKRCPSCRVKKKAIRIGKGEK